MARAGGISTLDLAELSVISSKLADFVITNQKLAPLSVNSGNIIDAAIIERTMADLAVSTAKLQDLSIATAKIADLAVQTGKLAALAVTTAKLDDASVITQKLADLGVTTAKLNDLAITTGKLADSSVVTAKLNDLGVTTAKLNDLAITTGKLADSSVVTAKLNDLGVTTGKLNDLAVATGKLADGAVTAAKVTAHTITANEIAALTITAAEIAALTITGAKIAATTIDAGKLVAHTITANEIAALTITAAEIAALTITGAKIAATTIDAGKLVAHTITANEIAALTITASEIAALTITGAKIAATTIDAGKLVAHTITANEIAALTITATEIATGTITSGKIGANEVKTANLDALAVTTAKLAAGSIVADKITVREVVALHISGGQSNNSNMWPNPTSEFGPPASYTPPGDGTDAEYDYRYNEGVGTAYSGAWVRQLLQTGAAGQKSLSLIVPVSTSETYGVMAFVKWVSTGGSPQFNIFTDFLDKDLAFISGGGTLVPTSQTTYGAYLRTSGTTPVNAVYVRISFALTTSASGTAEVRVDAIRAFRQIDGRTGVNDIVAGSIINANIGDNQIDAFKIIDSAVSAAKLGVQNYARAHTSALTTVVNGAETIIDYNSVDDDPDGKVTTGASWHYTAPRKGVYQVNASGGHNAGNSAATYINIFVNGTAVARGTRMPINGTGTVQISALVKLAANDTVDARVFQNSGANQTTENGYINTFSICRVSDTP